VKTASDKLCSDISVCRVELGIRGQCQAEAGVFLFDMSVLKVALG
jgi:hypothetical protein